MLQMLSFDVGRAPDVGCCTQQGSQHGRNIGRFGVCRGEGGSLLILDVARNTSRNMLAT
jgi:hypothetical protein